MRERTAQRRRIHGKARRYGSDDYDVKNQSKEEDDLADSVQTREPMWCYREENGDGSGRQRQCKPCPGEAIR